MKFQISRLFHRSSESVTGKYHVIFIYLLRLYSTSAEGL